MGFSNGSTHYAKKKDTEGYRQQFKVCEVSEVNFVCGPQSNWKTHQEHLITGNSDIALDSSVFSTTEQKLNKTQRDLWIVQCKYVFPEVISMWAPQTNFHLTQMYQSDSREQPKAKLNIWLDAINGKWENKQEIFISIIYNSFYTFSNVCQKRLPMFVYENLLGKTILALNCFVYRTGGVSLTGKYSKGQMCLHNHRKVYQSKLIIPNQGKMPGISKPTVILRNCKFAPGKMSQCSIMTTRRCKTQINKIL